MTEYWKSIPKYYCKFCNIWIVDNKSSREFHDRGLKHQNNVKNKIREAQRESSKAEKEAKEYEAQMRKIESAALSSFKGDIARDSKFAREVPTAVAGCSSKSDDNDCPRKPSIGRFGDTQSDDSPAESDKLLRGRSDALNTISKVLEKRSKWLEAVTAEGTIYYFNKDTLENRHDPPKGGYISLAEQAATSSSAPDPSKPDEIDQVRKYHHIYNPWQKVENETTLVDLELPNQDFNKTVESVIIEQQQLQQEKEEKETKTDEIIIKEKTVENCKRKITSSKDSIAFKKRSNAAKRSIRIKDENDD